MCCSNLLQINFKNWSPQLLCSFSLHTYFKPPCFLETKFLSQKTTLFKVGIALLINVTFLRRYFDKHIMALFFVSNLRVGECVNLHRVASTSSNVSIWRETILWQCSLDKRSINQSKNIDSDNNRLHYFAGVFFCQWQPCSCLLKTFWSIDNLLVVFLCHKISQP